MEVKMMPTVSSYELEEAIKLQYGLDVEIPTLLFPEDFMNDCFKEYAYKDTRWDEFCESDELCVRRIPARRVPAVCEYSRQDFLVIERR